MTAKDATRGTADLKALVASDPDFVRALMRTALQEVLEAEMTETVGAAKGERTEDRLGYRAGYYGRTLVTRVGKLELRVPQDREGRFSTEVFERYQRSERALVAALAEMYVQGVSTRKVKAITEELCGHRFSASFISAINKRLDTSLAQFAGRRLEEAYPYLILDARYERIREAGVIRSQAVLIAVAVGWDGRRSILGVELAHRESRSSWRDFLLGLKGRGLHGVEFVVADDHAGLGMAPLSTHTHQGVVQQFGVSSADRPTGSVRCGGRREQGLGDGEGVFIGQIAEQAFGPDQRLLLGHGDRVRQRYHLARLVFVSAGSWSRLAGVGPWVPGDHSHGSASFSRYGRALHSDPQLRAMVLIEYMSRLCRSALTPLFERNRSHTGAHESRAGPSLRPCTGFCNDTRRRTTDLLHHRAHASCQSAVDDEARTIDEVGIGAGEEEDRCGHVFGHANAPHRIPLAQGIEQVGAIA